MSVHSDQAPKTGIELCPDNYVYVVAKGGIINNMSILNLRPEELLFGMISVYDYLMSSGGDARGYFKHLQFVCRNLMERNFSVLACTKYDKHVVDQVIWGKGKFAELDPIGVGLFLHGGAVVRSDQPRPSSNQVYHPQQQNQNRFSQLRDCNRENTPTYMPENWPTDICFTFNIGACYAGALNNTSVDIVG